MADEIPGLGHTADIPKAVENPSFEGLQLGPEDWFLLSRIDGVVSMEELFLLSPKSRDETVGMLKRLLASNLIRLPNATSAQTASSSKKEKKGKRAFELPTGWPTAFSDFSFDEALLSVNKELDETFTKQLLYIHDHLKKISYYQLFGLRQGAESKDIRRAFFRFSKTFHPDRFFRQELGPLKERLEAIFRWVNEANQILSDPKQRSAYDAIVASGRVGAWASQVQVQASPATPTPEIGKPSLANLLKEARRCEQSGDFKNALKNYEGALTVRRSPELMNKAAECLVRLRQDLDRAARYARAAIDAAPDQVRYWVTFAYVYETKGDQDAAISAYQRALRIDPNHRGARQQLSRLKSRSG